MPVVERAPRPERSGSFPHTVVVANPHGQCAGVVRAIEGLREVIRKNPDQTIFGIHDIVHNGGVVKDFQAKGVDFVTDISRVPNNAIAVPSAHGLRPADFKEAQERDIQMVDATCPLVNKVHWEAEDYVAAGIQPILIGHRGHDEATGTMGVAPEFILLVETVEDAETIEVVDPEKVALIMQTTLSVEETRKIQEVLEERFPGIKKPNKSDICYATEHRQRAVRQLVKDVDAVVVFGTPDSSNSNRLREVAEAEFRAQGKDGFAIILSNASGLSGKEELFRGVREIGVTSGASVPEEDLQEGINWFSYRGADTIIQSNLPGVDESKIRFAPMISTKR